LEIHSIRNCLRGVCGSPMLYSKGIVAMLANLLCLLFTSADAGDVDCPRTGCLEKTSDMDAEAPLLEFEDTTDVLGVDDFRLMQKRAEVGFFPQSMIKQQLEKLDEQGPPAETDENLYSDAGLKQADESASSKKDSEIWNPPEVDRIYSSVYAKDKKGTGHCRSKLDSLQAWSSGKHDSGEWMMINLKEDVMVDGVITQGRYDNAWQYVVKFKIMHLAYGRGWQTISQEFLAGKGNNKEKAYFPETVKARYVKFVVQTWTGWISMRAGVLISKASSEAQKKNDAPTQACNELLTGNRGSGYRGCQSVTKSGRTCQRWTSQSPHPHSRTPAYYANKGLGSHNYCRNPDNGKSIWCYTTDPNSRWEYCNPIQCNELLTGARGSGYRGCQTVTRSGRTCQFWNSKQPHDHDRTPVKYPYMGLGPHNFCRNPDNENTIWCYTTDPNRRWEYCNPKQVCAVQAKKSAFPKYDYCAGHFDYYYVYECPPTFGPVATSVSCSGGCCKPCSDMLGGKLENCITCNPILGCTKCEEGYIIAIEQGYRMCKKLPKIPNCARASQSGAGCLECESGYRVEYDTGNRGCTQNCKDGEDCQSGYGCNSFYQTCQQCPDPTTGTRRRRVQTRRRRDFTSSITRRRRIPAPPSRRRRWVNPFVLQETFTRSWANSSTVLGHGNVVACGADSHCKKGQTCKRISSFDLCGACEGCKSGHSCNSAGDGCPAEFACEGNSVSGKKGGCCKPCDVNGCFNCQSDSSQCTVCKTGYGLSQDKKYCNKCPDGVSAYCTAGSFLVGLCSRTNCTKRGYYNPSTPIPGCCSKCPSKCKTYGEHCCESCEDGYSLVEGTGGVYRCVPCPKTKGASCDFGPTQCCTAGLFCNHQISVSTSYKGLIPDIKLKTGGKCQKASCSPPADTTGYDVSGCTSGGSECRPKCAAGYAGYAQAVCDSNAKFKFSGCKNCFSGKSCNKWGSGCPDRHACSGFDMNKTSGCCEACASDTNCLDCHLDKNKCILCDDGYEVDDKTKRCKKCTSGVSAKCIKGQFLTVCLETTCSKVGYYNPTETGPGCCNKCPTTCKTYGDHCCSSCEDGYFKVKDDKLGVWKCEKCPSGCKTCGTIQGCSKCDGYVWKAVGQSIEGVCTPCPFFGNGCFGERPSDCCDGSSCTTSGKSRWGTCLKKEKAKSETEYLLFRSERTNSSEW